MRWLSAGEMAVPEGRAWLSGLETGRLDAIRFTKRRTEYLLRRYTGKLAVATAAGMSTAPDDLARIELLNRLTGAPYVHIDGTHAGVDISLTDRAGWAVALVSPQGTLEAGTLGVDLEIVEPRSAAFVGDFLTPAEQAYVAVRRAQHGQDGWDAAANLVWSAKEAALKVLRVGLRADTRTVEVHVDHDVRPDGWGALRVTGRDGTVFPGWWRRDGIFVLTIAYRAGALPPEQLPGGADLSVAAPIYSWLARPTTQDGEGAR